jgi:hypothetical protein
MGRPKGSKNKAKKTPPAGSNTKRDLAAIAVDINTLERRSIFDIGKLLIEARDVCEHGDWYAWLESEFDWSEDTAENYMAASRLGAKYRTVRDLKVPATTLYELGADVDDPNLPAFIDALAKASKSAKINVATAEEAIRFTRLRIEHGNYPETTLIALSHLTDSEWEKRAAESLKKAKPTTNEEAELVARPHYRAYVEMLFDSPLPDWLNSEMLGVLEGTSWRSEEQRKRIAQELNAAPTPPPDPGQVISDIIRAVPDEGEDEQDDEPAPRPEPKPPKPEAQETDPVQAAAAAVTRSDIGPLSQAEHERLTTVIADLTSENSRHKTALAGRDNEIARLEGEVKTLKDLPTLTADKHIDALAALLKKVSREAQELAVEKLCKKLGLDPHKLNIAEAA